MSGSSTQSTSPVCNAAAAVAGSGCTNPFNPMKCTTLATREVAPFHSQSQCARRNTHDGAASQKLSQGSAPLPPHSTPGFETVAVESPRDDCRRGRQRQGAHGLNDVGGRTVALSPPPPWQPVLSMDSAYPMDGQDDLGRGISRSAMASRMTVRTIRFLSRASVVGADQTVCKSSASAVKEIDTRTSRGCAAAS
jgi:hypothetical protein